MRTLGKITLALGAGVAAGAILGILFSPDKGSEIRRKIYESADDYADRVKTAMNSMAGRMKASHNGHDKREKVEEHFWAG